MIDIDNHFLYTIWILYTYIFIYVYSDIDFSPLESIVIYNQILGEVKYITVVLLESNISEFTSPKLRFVHFVQTSTPQVVVLV